MSDETRQALAEFAKGILTYVEDGNVVELRECGFVQELLNTIELGNAEVKEEE